MFVNNKLRFKISLWTSSVLRSSIVGLPGPVRIVKSALGATH